MAKAETQLTEEQLAEIKKTGKSIYMFLQEAVNEKIKRKEFKKEFEEILDKKLLEFANTLSRQMKHTLDSFVASKIDGERQAVLDRFEIWHKHFKEGIVEPLISTFTKNKQ